MSGQSCVPTSPRIQGALTGTFRAGGGVARRRKPDGECIHLGSRRDGYTDDARPSAQGRIRG
jgi:hypothetical protein